VCVGGGGEAVCTGYVCVGAGGGGPRQCVQDTLFRDVGTIEPKCYLLTVTVSPPSGMSAYPCI
jgi:hypothetical protein